jgi:hypothetical protein
MCNTFDGPHCGRGEANVSEGNAPAYSQLSAEGEVARFARLLVVAVAWSAPLLPAVWVNDARGCARHPGLAHIFAQHTWQLFIAMLLVGCVGVAVVAVLGRRRVPRVMPWLLAPLGVLALIFIFFTAPIGAAWWWYVGAYAMLLIPLGLVLAGVAATFSTLWRWRRWLAGTWFALWLAGSLFVYVATEQLPNSGGPGDGLVVLFTGAPLLLVAVLAAAAGSVLSRLPDWLAETRHIEQAVRADRP